MCCIYDHAYAKKGNYEKKIKNFTLLYINTLLPTLGYAKIVKVKSTQWL